MLFVGLGVDFGIQFSVRYRSERFKNEDLALALESAASRCAVPLSLAAMATAAGFLCFLPTDYKGISELGKIAGAGMLIAFITSITALPAMLKLLHPPGESEPVGYAFLAPVDEFLERHRVIIVVGTLLLVVAGLPLLYFMKFDFNPINLRNPKAESIATFLDLRKDPNTGANAINVLTTSEAEAKKIEARLEKLPEVLRVMSIDSFVPEDQPAKLQLIAKAARVVGPALNPDSVDAAPTDQENVEALKSSVDSLRRTAGDGKGPGAVASRRLADALSKLAGSNQATRDKAQNIFVAPLKIVFDQLKNTMQAGPVTMKTLPPELLNSWKSKDGLIRVEALPKGDPNDNDNLRRFADTVLAAEPNAIGGPVSILKSGDTVVKSVHPCRHLGAAGDQPVALFDAAADLRRADDDGAAAGGRCGDAGALRADRAAAQLRQYRRIAAAARRRRRLQDLLRHGLARGQNQPAAVEPDARDLFLGADDRDRLRKPVAIQSSRHRQHGQIAGAVVRYHAGRGAAVPARANGQTARCRGVGRYRRYRRAGQPPASERARPSAPAQD